MPAPFTFAAVADRRGEPRLGTDVLGLDADARLTLGVHVQVVNVSRGGALVESGEWLRPGTRTELRLTRSLPGGDPELMAATAAVSRCWVHRLSPLRYRSALVFTERPLSADDADGLEPGEVEVVLADQPA
ncbi:MAG: PilZ domain-containing protein [Vicinamibacterales bacterium]